MPLSFLLVYDSLSSLVDEEEHQRPFRAQAVGDLYAVSLSLQGRTNKGANAKMIKGNNKPSQVL